MMCGLPDGSKGSPPQSLYTHRSLELSKTLNPLVINTPTLEPPLAPSLTPLSMATEKVEGLL